MVALSTEGAGAGIVAGVARLGFPQPLLFAWAATISELAGGLLVAVGLFARVAAVFAAITMAVAAFMRHRLAHHVLVWLGVLDASPETVKGWGNPELRGGLSRDLPGDRLDGQRKVLGRSVSAPVRCPAGVAQFIH